MLTSAEVDRVEELGQILYLEDEKAEIQVALYINLEGKSFS